MDRDRRGQGHTGVPFPRRRLLQLGGSGVAALLAGCLGDGDDEPAETGTDENDTSGNGTPENDDPQASSDITLDLLWPGEIGSMNPLGWQNIRDYDAVRMLYEPLTSVDSDARPVGHLARDWSVSGDGQTYTWQIREGVTWHDGEPLTAEDVAFTFETIKTSDWSYLGSLSEVIGPPAQITVEDDTTVRTPLTQPYAPLPLAMADVGFVVPKHIWEQFDDPTEPTNTEDPTGSGPFTFESRAPGESVEFGINDDYWNDRPAYDGATINVVKSTEDRVERMQAGDADLFRLRPGGAVTDVQDSEGLSVVEAGSTLVTYVRVNTRRDPLSDRALRRALAYAIDREAIVDSVVRGFAEVGDAVVPSGLEFFHNPGVTAYGHDPDRARTVLDENGYEQAGGRWHAPDGTELSFAVSVRDNGTWPALAEAVAEQLDDFGIQTTADATAQRTYDQQVRVENDYDLSVDGWRVWFDPGPFLSPVFEQQGDLNVTGFTDEQFQSLMQQQRRTTDSNERQNLIYQAQEVLAEELPWVVLYYPDLMYAARSEAWTNLDPIPRYGMQSPYGHESGTGPLLQMRPR